MKHLQKFILLSLSTLTVLSSCQKTNPDAPAIEDPTEFTVSKDSTRFNVTKACWLLPSASGFEDLYSKATFQEGMTAESDAELVVTDMSGLDTYDDLLSSVYDDGSVIVVTNPDIVKLEEIMADNDWNQMVPGEKEDVILYAFCQHGAYALNRIGGKIVIDENGVVDVPFELDEEKKNESTSEDFSGEEAFEDPYKDIDFTELGYYIAPFTKWINEHLGLTPVNEDPKSDYKIAFEHQHTYQCDLFVYKLSKRSDEDRIKGNLPVVARYELQPYYIYPEQGHPEGDYYMVKANYSCEMNVPGGMFQGDDRIQQHWRMFVHICGAFLRKFDVKTYIQNGKKYSPKVTFYPTGTPKPATDINTTNYAQSTEHSVNFGVNGGGGMENRYLNPQAPEPFKFLGRWELKGHLDYGYKRSNHISYSVRDLSVRNNSSAIGATAAWEFECNNLPAPKKHKEFTRRVPGIARSSTLLDASWIWNAATSDWCPYSVGELVTEIHPTLGACCNGVCVKSKNHSYDIGMVRITSKLIVPRRIPFGTMSFDNRFKGDTIINNISVVYKGEHGKQEEVFKSVGDFQRDVSCKCNIPEGPYEVTLDVTDESGNIKKFKNKRNITLSRRLGENDIQHCIVSRANFEEVK